MGVARGAHRRGTACMILLGAVAAIGLVSCQASSRSPAIRAPESHAPYALRSIPHGWFVFRAFAQPDTGGPSQTLYARRGFDARRDPALLVGQVSEDVDLPAPGPDAKPIPGLGFGSSSIGHAGDYTVAYWTRDADITTYVMARGVADADVTRAARAADFGAGAPTIPDAARPRGFEPVATAPLPPRLNGGGGQAIALATADWKHHVQMTIAELDPPTQTVETFLRDLPAATEQGPIREASVGSATVFAQGDASPATLDGFVRAVGPVPARAWTVFQLRVLDVPNAVLFPTCQSLAGTVVITAVRGDIRWAVALPGGPKPGGPCVGTSFVRAGSSTNGYSSAIAGRAQPWFPGPGSFGAVTVFAGNGSSSGADDSMTLGGTVPAGTVLVVAVGPRGPVRAQLADGASDRSRRFYGVYLEGFTTGAGAVRVTAYAADGHALGRWVLG